MYSLVYVLVQHLTEPSKRNRTSSHCNLYQSWEMSFPKSTCEGRGGPIGVQEETEATEEGSDGVVGVIQSRLKPEQEGLVTKAYLRRRHWGSETVALWENLLQQTCRKRGHGEKFEGKEILGDTRRKAESGERGRDEILGRKKKDLRPSCIKLVLIQHKDGNT